MEQEGDGMSILIKGMDMPKNCKECDLYIEGACYAKGYRDYRLIMDKSKPDDCPLIELPPHGRLIDADELANKTFYSKTSAPYITYKKFCDAPTVIEGSET